MNTQGQQDEQVRQCQQPGVNPDDWFSARPARVERAKRLCDQCPARSACLRLALEEEDPEGIWGGLTGAERAALTHTPIRPQKRSAVRTATTRPPTKGKGRLPDAA